MRLSASRMNDRTTRIETLRYYSRYKIRCVVARPMDPRTSPSSALTDRHTVQLMLVYSYPFVRQSRATEPFPGQFCKLLSSRPNCNIRPAEDRWSCRRRNGRYEMLACCLRSTSTRLRCIVHV